MEGFDKKKAYRELCEFFAAIESAEEIEKVLDDLCTYKETEQMAQRLLCAKLLLKGYTYSRIIEMTEISSATLSRISRCINRGSGGYREVLGRYAEKSGDIEEGGENEEKA